MQSVLDPRDGWAHEGDGGTNGAGQVEESGHLVAQLPQAAAPTSDPTYSLLNDGHHRCEAIQPRIILFVPAVHGSIVLVL